MRFDPAGLTVLSSERKDAAVRSHGECCYGKGMALQCTPLTSPLGGVGTSASEQSPTVLSSGAEASKRPSGAIARACTFFVWPINVNSNRDCGFGTTLSATRSYRPFRFLWRRGHWRRAFRQ